MNEIIKELEERFGESKYITSFKTFILTKLKEERIKTLEEVRIHAMTQYVSYRDFESIIDRMINNLKK